MKLLYDGYDDDLKFDGNYIMSDLVALYFTLTLFVVVIVVLLTLFCCTSCKEIRVDVNQCDYELVGVDSRQQVQLTSYNRKNSQISPFLQTL